MPNLIIPIGKRKEDCSDCHSHPYAEFVIKPAEIAVYPGLLLRIKKAMANHSNAGNSHSNCMARLNSIPELTQIIHKHQQKVQSKQKTTKKRKRVSFDEVAMATNKKQRTPAQSNNEKCEQAVEWQRSGLRILDDLQLTYRTYKTKLQLDGTFLPGGCFGYTDSPSFNSVKNIRAYVSKVPASNLIHSILSSQNKGIPVSQHSIFPVEEKEERPDQETTYLSALSPTIRWVRE